MLSVSRRFAPLFTSLRRSGLSANFSSSTRRFTTSDDGDTYEKLFSVEDGAESSGAPMHDSTSPQVSTEARNISKKSMRNDGVVLEHLLGRQDTQKPRLSSEGDEDMSYPPVGPVNPLRTSSRTQKAKGRSPFVAVKSLHETKIYHLYAQTTYNNTILTLTNEEGLIREWTSGGRCGFKNSKRATYEAGYQCAVQMFEKILARKKAHEPEMTLEILFNGRGAGREALSQALKTSEGEEIRGMVVAVTDKTSIKVGGTRAKKRRRL